MNIFSRLTFYFLISSLFFCSCVSQKIKKNNVFNIPICQTREIDSSKYDSLYQAEFMLDTVISPLVHLRFSADSKNVSLDIGCIKLLNQFTEIERKLKQKYSDSLELKFLRIKQGILERIQLANMEVSLTLAEIECEHHRAIELKNYIDQITNKKIRRLTILSILANALTTAVGSVIALNGGPQLNSETVISGGALLSAYWGIDGLFVSVKQQFDHEKNFLKDIWERPAKSKLFPPVVWNFLTRSFETKNERVSIQETIVNQWGALKLFSQKPSKQQKTIDLLMSNGGLYGSDEISTRISFYDILETGVKIMRQELKQLQQEIILSK